MKYNQNEFFKDDMGEKLYLLSLGVISYGNFLNEFVKNYVDNKTLSEEIGKLLSAYTDEVLTPLTNYLDTIPKKECDNEG